MKILMRPVYGLISIGCMVASGVLNALAIMAGERDEDDPFDQDVH